MNNVFDKMKETYLNILRNYYPAHGNLGFTEKNLSVVFTEAYKSLHPNTIAWFEAPLEKENGCRSNQHVDVVIFDLDTKTMILVESKRIYDDRKLESAKNDLKRLMNKKHLDYLSEYLVDANIFQQTAVILADIWTDKKQKEKRLKKWQNKEIFEPINGEYYDRKILEKPYINSMVQCDYHILGFVHSIE